MNREDSSVFRTGVERLVEDCSAHLAVPGTYEVGRGLMAVFGERVIALRQDWSTEKAEYLKEVDQVIRMVVSSRVPDRLWVVDSLSVSVRTAVARPAEPISGSKRAKQNKLKLECFTGFLCAAVELAGDDWAILARLMDQLVGRVKQADLWSEWNPEAGLQIAKNVRSERKELLIQALRSGLTSGMEELKAEMNRAKEMAETALEAVVKPLIDGICGPKYWRVVGLLVNLTVDAVDQMHRWSVHQTAGPDVLELAGQVFSWFELADQLMGCCLRRVDPSSLSTFLDFILRKRADMSSETRTLWIEVFTAVIATQGTVDYVSKKLSEAFCIQPVESGSDQATDLQVVRGVVECFEVFRQEAEFRPDLALGVQHRVKSLPADFAYSTPGADGALLRNAVWFEYSLGVFRPAVFMVVNQIFPECSVDGVDASLEALSELIKNHFSQWVLVSRPGIQTPIAVFEAFFVEIQAFMDSNWGTALIGAFAHRGVADYEKLYDSFLEPMEKLAPAFFNEKTALLLADKLAEFLCCITGRSDASGQRFPHSFWRIADELLSKYSASPFFLAYDSRHKRATSMLRRDMGGWFVTGERFEDSFKRAIHDFLTNSWVIVDSPFSMESVVRFAQRLADTFTSFQRSCATDDGVALWRRFAEVKLVDAIQKTFGGRFRSLDSLVELLVSVMDDPRLTRARIREIETSLRAWQPRALDDYQTARIKSQCVLVDLVQIVINKRTLAVIDLRAASIFQSFLPFIRNPDFGKYAVDKWRNFRAHYTEMHEEAYYREVDKLLLSAEWPLPVLPEPRPRKPYQAPQSARAPNSASTVPEEPVRRRHGFRGNAADINELVTEIRSIVTDSVLSWPLPVPQAETRLRSDVLFQLTDEVAFCIKSAERVVLSDHSGLVVFLTSLVEEVFLPKLDAVQAKAIADGLGALLGTVALDKEKTRSRATISAVDLLKTWFEFETVDEPSHAAVVADEPKAHLDLSVGQPAVKLVSFDEESGILGDPAKVTELKTFAKEAINRTVAGLREAFASKGLVPVTKLDEVREVLQLELVDRNLVVSDLSKWMRFVSTTTSCILPSHMAWMGSLLAVIFCAKDVVTSQARRKLVTDKRSPFCKQAAENQSDGSFKFRWVDEGGELEWQGLLIKENEIGKFKSLLDSGIAGFLQLWLEVPSDPNVPKPFSIIETLSDEVELARLEVGAVVEQPELLTEYLAGCLSSIDEWHRSQIAAYCAAQYSSSDSRESARLRELLLTDRQSDFAVDPYTGWRPVFPDSKLELSQLTRLVFAQLGFSVQAAVSDEEMTAILGGCFRQHFSRWQNRRMPYSWSLVDGLLRDLRAEALRVNLHVEDSALMAIAIEGLFESSTPWDAADQAATINGLLSQYVVEMLAIRPSSKTAAIFKGKLVKSLIFTDKERVVPEPLAVNLGFDAEQEDFVKAAVVEALQEVVAEGGAPERLGRKLIAKIVGIEVVDQEAFRRFITPEVTLLLKKTGLDKVVEADAVVYEVISSLAQ